jgi:tetratricopeptide (TPR) repeat protein
MAGRQIGPYKVLSTLYEGSDEHRVLLTQREGVERLFAVKLFRPDLPSDLVERIQRGARLAAKVEHPYVVRPVEVGRTPEGSLYVACEHVLGESVRSCLERQGRYHWREAANLVADAAEGVEAAHRAGLVHRDLSPERLVFNRKTGHAMVLDFGLARDTLQPSELSKTGELIGSLVYMSPEQLAGQRAESASDVYALGTLLYELIAGELPYLGRDLEELQQKVAAGQRLDLRKHVPEVPRELVELLDRAMSVDPRRRPPAKVLAQSLRDLGSVETAIPTAVLHARERGVRPGVVGASFALWFLVLGGVAAWAISSHTKAREAEERSAAAGGELEARQRALTKAHEERAEALQQLNQISSELTAAREENRRAAQSTSDARRRAERLERRASADRDSIKALEIQLAKAAEAVKRLGARSGAQPDGPGKDELLATTTRGCLDWVTAELAKVPGGLSLRAKLLHNRGHYEEALALLEGRELELELEVLRARTLFKLGRVKEARAIFSEVATQSSETSHGLFCRGIEAKDPNKRLELMRRAVERDPAQGYIRITLSNSLTGVALQTRRVELGERALAVITEGVRLEPTSYQIYEARAQALTVLGTLKRDQALLQKALLDLRRARVFYADPMIRLRTSDVYRSLRQHQRALAELRLGVTEADALKRSMPRLRMRVALASLALNLKARPEGVRALRELAEVDPKLHEEVAEVYGQLPPAIRREVLRGLSPELRASFEK